MPNPNPNAYGGRGTILQYSLTGTAPWTELDQIRQFEPAGDGSKQIFVDQTNLQTSGNFTQPTPVQVDAGEIEVAGVYSGSAEQLALGQYHGTMALVYWQAKLVDGTYWSFAAYVSAFKAFSVKVNKANLWTAKLRLTGGMESPLSAFQPGAFDPAAFQVVLI